MGTAAMPLWPPSRYHGQPSYPTCNLSGTYLPVGPESGRSGPIPPHIAEANRGTGIIPGQYHGPAPSGTIDVATAASVEWPYFGVGGRRGGLDPETHGYEHRG